MKKLVLLGMAVVLILIANTREADAFGCCRKASCESTPMCVTYVDKVVTCYKPTWKEEKITYKVNRIVCKEVITKEKCTSLVPKYYDEKRQCTYLVRVPKIVEQEVVRCRMVCVNMVDPCTGCTYVCRRPETYTEKVKCTVYECQTQVKDVIVRVCKMEPVTRDVEVRRIVRECVPEMVTTTRRVCQMVPTQTTVRVAVCVPCCSVPPMPDAK